MVRTEAKALCPPGQWRVAVGWILSHWCSLACSLAIRWKSDNSTRGRSYEANPEHLPEVKAEQLQIWTWVRTPWVIHWGMTHDVPLHSHGEATWLTANDLVPFWYLLWSLKLRSWLTSMYIDESVYMSVFGRQWWMTKPLTKVMDFDISGVVWLACKLTHSRF